MSATPCPCGLPETYGNCCGRFHRGEAAAPTAERLMRSRFSAFAVRDSAYLLRTWHRTTRPPRVTVDPAQCWDRLEILATTGGALFDSDGTVEFRAHYRHHGLPRTHHETSRFVREDGCWAYLDETGGHTDE